VILPFGRDFTVWVGSGGLVVDAGQQLVEQVGAVGLVVLGGVVALAAQGGPEFDAGLEQGAGFADGFEGAVQFGWAGAVAVAGEQVGAVRRCCRSGLANSGTRSAKPSLSSVASALRSGGLRDLAYRATASAAASAGSGRRRRSRRCQVSSSRPCSGCRRGHDAAQRRTAPRRTATRNRAGPGASRPCGAVTQLRRGPAGRSGHGC
jgi:hypothetical protein